MHGSLGTGRRGLMVGLVLLLAALAPPTHGADFTGAELYLQIEPYVRFLFKYPEQGVIGGFSPIVVTTTDVLKGSQGIKVLKESRSNVSLLSNGACQMSFPTTVHYDGPAGGVDLGTSMFSTVMKTRAPDPYHQVAFSSSGGTWSSMSAFTPGLTFVGVINAATNRIWTTVGTYTGTVVVTIISQ